MTLLKIKALNKPVSHLKASFPGLDIQARVECILPSPLGKLGLSFSDGKLIRLEMMRENAALIAAPDSTSQHIASELEHYFKNPQHLPSFDYHIKGTPFQLKVWEALRTIPSGKPLTYGELAKRLKTSPRAVGQACKTNPIPILIPCHRVVGMNSLGGYAGKRTGKMMDIKQWLLEHEALPKQQDNMV